MMASKITLRPAQESDDELLLKVYPSRMLELSR
jgi:hypothetical protein